MKQAQKIDLQLTIFFKFKQNGKHIFPLRGLVDEKQKPVKFA